MRTVAQTISKLPRSPRVPVLSAPPYIDSGKPGRLALAVESMARHMTDEGWQIMQGLESAGYVLAGHRCTIPETHVPTLLEQIDPGVVLIQDKREWDVRPDDFREQEARFRDVEILATRPDIFKLTILKDSHHRPIYHRGSAEEMGVHGWIIYYHPRVVQHNAPYLRKEHLIRTYHSLDTALVPTYSDRRNGSLLSGAVSAAYPVRTQMINYRSRLTQVTYLPHPGYHRDGCATPEYLQLLTQFKVAICTSSLYGYALRKIIEATACGCVVVTDLPTDEVLPEIDSNLVRLTKTDYKTVTLLLNKLYAEYDPKKQQILAEKAKAFYDYRVVGRQLADDIESLRRIYQCR